MGIPPIKRHKSLRKCSMFMTRSRWDIWIEYEDLEYSESAAAKGTTGERRSGIFQANIGKCEDGQCARTEMGYVNGVSSQNHINIKFELYRNEAKRGVFDTL